MQTMPAVTVDQIDADLAVRAFYGTSHSPEQRGVASRNGYVDTLTDAWNKAIKAAGTDEEAQARVVSEFVKLRDGYQDRLHQYLRAHSRVMSSMIAGRSNFPVARQRKAGDVADKRAAEADEFFRKGFARVLKAAREPIDNTPSGEVESIRARIAAREKKQVMMKAVNAALRKNDDNALRALGVTDDQVVALKKPDFAGRPGFPSYKLTNNNSEIRRLRERLAQAESRVTAAQAGPAEQVTNGVRVVEDAEADRLQLFFDGKPDDAKRAALKKNGFRWAPSVGAWQRQLTDNARRDAQRIVG